MFVDSGQEGEPDSRWFGTLDKALAAVDQLPEDFRRFAWVIEFRPIKEHEKKGMLVHAHERTVTHMRDGKKEML